LLTNSNAERLEFLRKNFLRRDASLHLLNFNEVRRLGDNEFITLGGHTYSHFDLGAMSCETEIFEEIKLDVYNSVVKLAGKPKFDDIKLKLRDDMTNLVTNKVAEQMQKQFDFFEQASAASGLDYKFTTYIEILDGGNGAYEPIALETFELQGCWIKALTYDGGDYGKSTEAMNVELTICYDNALQTVGINGGLVGIGIPVGRTVGTTAIGS
jgi:hypothetical protein